MSTASDDKAVLTRLRGWWHGEEIDPTVDNTSAAEDMTEAAEQPAVAAASDGPAGGVSGRIWDADSIAAVQMVCGPGCSIPGGEEFAEESIKNMGLKESMNIVDYGAQLGQFARVIARTAGAWVDGYEPVASLAEAASRLAEESKLGKKVVLNQCDLLQVPVKLRSRDAIVSVEAMQRGADRVAQMQNIARMLKPGGRLMVIDYFRQIEEPTSPAIEQWREHEVLQPGIPTLEEVRKAMAEVGVRIQVSQDITEVYCKNLTTGLRRLAKHLSQHPPDSAMHGAVLREVEFWGARLAVLQSGDMAVLRVNAALGSK
jgi:cyclopropane fatty-acyl-phospholipid synthase-like methyltransferase